MKHTEIKRMEKKKEWKNEETPGYIQSIIRVKLTKKRSIQSKESGPKKKETTKWKADFGLSLTLYCDTDS